MSRALLKYRGPKNGQAFIRTVRLNAGQEVYLGKYGSPESYRAYVRYLAKLAADPDPMIPQPALAAGECRLIVELVDLYTTELRAHMTQGGKLKKEYHNIARALANLDEGFGDLPANDFEPTHLEELQRRLAAARISRNLLNKRITIVKRFFAWCSKQHAKTGSRKTLYHERSSPNQPR